jgi:uncharacterized protein DUF1566
MPNAASSGLPNPASYTAAGNGLALYDNLTCLTWALAAGASGDLTANTAYCAQLASSTYAGYGDWRLPTRVEVASIVDLTRSGDALNPMFGRQPGGYFRTGSAWYETVLGINGNTGAMARRWIYNMGSGLTSNNFFPASAASALCVRGNGTGETIDQLAVEPPNHYTVGNGEVTDNYTGLIWQQAFSSAQMAWSAAAGYCSGLGLNGHAWRVPSLNELASTVDEANVGPAVSGQRKSTIFPNTVYCSTGGVQNYYWAHEQEVGSSFSWGLNYCDGFTAFNSASAAFDTFPTGYVRCVR